MFNSTLFSSGFIFKRYMSYVVPSAKNININLQELRKIYNKNPKYLKYNKQAKKNTQIVNKKREIEDKKNINNLKHKIELHESHSPKKIIYY